MINWNALKNLDVKDIDLTKVDLTRFDIRKLELPNFELPNFELPKFELPKFETPELPVDADRVVGIARDAAYAGVGVAVVTVQKLDAQRRELAGQISAQVRKVVDAVA